MARWTLDTPIEIIRSSLVQTPDTVDEIRMAAVLVNFEKRKHAPDESTMLVTIQYGLLDDGFVVISEENHLLEGESFVNIMQTGTGPGKIQNRMETLIWAELLSLGLIPPGS